MMADSRPPRTANIGASVSILVAVLCCALWGTYLERRETTAGFPLDDTWIHLQFARNLAEGQGFSFNPGVSSSGSSAPFWTLAARRAARPRPAAAGRGKIARAGSGGVTALAAAALTRRLSGDAVGGTAGGTGGGHHATHGVGRLVRHGGAALRGARHPGHARLRASAGPPRSCGNAVGVVGGAGGVGTARDIRGRGASCPSRGCSAARATPAPGGSCAAGGGHWSCSRWSDRALWRSTWYTGGRPLPNTFYAKTLRHGHGDVAGGGPAARRAARRRALPGQPAGRRDLVAGLARRAAVRRRAGRACLRWPVRWAMPAPRGGRAAARGAGLHANRQRPGRATAGDAGARRPLRHSSARARPGGLRVRLRGARALSRGRAGSSPRWRSPAWSRWAARRRAGCRPTPRR